MDALSWGILTIISYYILIKFIKKIIKEKVKKESDDYTAELR